MVCRDFILPKTANYVSFFIPFSICATYSTLSSVMMALGAGLLLSLLFSSEFVLVVLGIALLVAGLCLARRR